MPSPTSAHSSSESDVDVIREQFGWLSGEEGDRHDGQDAAPIFIRDLSCAKLLEEYSRTLFVVGTTNH